MQQQWQRSSITKLRDMRTRRSDGGRRPSSCCIACTTCPSPIDTSVVYLSLRRAAQTKGRRPKQVRGLTADILADMLKACPDTLIGLRDAALISVGYDTLCRSAELSWMEVGHIELQTCTAYIPRAKNDPFGDGRLARLSQETVIQVDRWLEESKINEGPLFRGLSRGTPNPGPMETSSIRRLIKTAARRASVDENIVVGLSGHSMRVGAAQDLMIAGYDTVAIMTTAGGWKNVEVVARYVEKAALRRRCIDPHTELNKRLRHSHGEARAALVRSVRRTAAT